MVMEGQFVQREETGFIRVHGQNKEAITDESAQHQSRSKITLYKQPQWRQAKREAQALLHNVRADFLSVSSRDAAEGRPPSLLQIPEHVESSASGVTPARDVPSQLCSRLASRDGDAAALKSFLCFTALPLQWRACTVVGGPSRHPRAVFPTPLHLT